MLKFENKVNGRYYYLQKHIDMLGHFTLVVTRGGRAVNVIRRYGFDCEIALTKKIEILIKRRLQRGYSLIQ